MHTSLQLWWRNWLHKTIPGFSLVELMVAMGIFVIMATSVVTAALFSQKTHRLVAERVQAIAYVDAGMEAVRSLQRQGWDQLVVGTHGLSDQGGYWQLSGSSDQQGVFTRAVTIAVAQRSGGAIVSSGGSTDPQTKVITVEVTWPGLGSQEHTVESVSYLTNWSQEIIVEEE